MADANATIEALAKEVRYLRDKLDIQDCIYRYCRGLDRLDRELALSAYHADGIDDRGGTAIGSPAFFMDWIFPELRKYKGTSHSISNITYDIAGDVAHTESYITFHVWMPDGTVSMGFARYIDRLERRSSRWGIVHREVLIDYRAQLAALPTRSNELTASQRSKEDRSYARPLDLTEDGKRRLAEKKKS